MLKLLRCLCGFCLLAIPSSAFAQNYLISWSGPFGAGSATVAATHDGGGQFQITSMSNATQGGSAITLVNPGGYGGNDNFIFPSYPAALTDNNGFSFTDGVNDYDIFLPIQSITDQTGAIPNTYYECTSAQSDCVGCPAPTCASPIAYLSVTPAPVAVALLDPAPSLFAPTTSNITTDLNTLATGGKTVSAVAADGVAQLLIRLGGLAQGQQVNVSIVDETNSVPATGEDGTLSIPLGGTTAGPASVSPTPQFASAINGYDGFVLYQSPIDFVRASGRGAGDLFIASHQVTIQITDTNNNLLASSALLILRPPVFFVHGLWGDPGTWDQWNKYLMGMVNGISTYKADYESTNGLGVDRNTPTVLAQAQGALQSFRDANSAAAAQLDFIVHSMGGLISNNLVKEPAWATPDNYGTGYIHKLITVDTPYQGSPLAINTAKSSPSCKQELAGKGLVVATAIRDLIPTSTFLQNFTIPSGLYYKHAIASYVTAEQSTSAGNSIDNLDLFIAGLSNPVYSECFEIFNAPVGNGPPNFSFPTYFLTPGDPYKGESNLVVSVLSQLGPAAQPFTVGSTAHTTSGLAHSHAVLPVFGKVILPGSLDANIGTPLANPDLGIALLNSSVTSTGANSFVH